MTVYAPLVGTLWRTLESYGIDPRRVIDEPHYQPGDPCWHTRRIPWRAYEQMELKTAELIKDPVAGIRAGELLHPSHLGALGHAWLASSNLMTAIKRAQRFSRMYHELIRITISNEIDVLKITYRLRQPSAIPDLVADAQLACLVNLCRLNFGKSLVPAYVHMCRHEPKDSSPWNMYFGVKVAFNQAENCVALRKSDALKPLTGHDPVLADLHDDVVRRYIVSLDRSNVLNTVMMAIMRQLPSGGLSEKSIASELNLTTRTLHRRLREQGVGFRDLLTDVRKEMVERYIKDPVYSITEISFLLGYTNTSAFSRAFRRWYGKSPTEFRDNLSSGV